MMRLTITETLRYAAEAIDTHSEKFPVPSHMISHAATVREAADLLEEAVKALDAENEADAAFDAADEITHRADAEDWLNDPTGSLHVAEAWGRAGGLRAKAKAMRADTLTKIQGE